MLDFSAMDGATNVVDDGVSTATEQNLPKASKVYDYPKQPLGKKHRIKIILVGAGITGISAVKLFKEAFPARDVDFVVYEKNNDVTGTWLENRYPGCACDVPAHSYTFPWEGNPRWSRAYVGAVELYEWFKDRATAYGVDEFVRLEHLVTGASWDDRAGKWTVNLTDLRSGLTFTDEAEILINSTGFLNSWKWPDIPGMQDFKGKLLHSARWDDGYDFKDKTVAIIGSGSSAIQIVPQLMPVVKHMYSIHRSKTWIVPEVAAELAPQGRESFFTDAQKDAWTNDKAAFLAYRKKVDSVLNGSFAKWSKTSELQKAAVERVTKLMRAGLGNNEELISKLVPDFAVGCRRPTPGHGYLEALTSQNVTVRNDAIEAVTATGLRLADGPIEVDAIICATGFDTSFRPGFPVISSGKDLRDIWKDEPRSYLSIATPAMPNYFVMTGPNFPVANGSAMPCFAANVQYAFAAAKKIQYEGIKSLRPKQQATDDFQEYKDAIMNDLVWTGSCTSWYKNGKRDGKVWGPWPGSNIHYLEIMSTPRWEDYDIEYFHQNRFNYFGNGFTMREVEGGDLSYYMTEPGAGES